MTKDISYDLQQILTQAIEVMKEEAGVTFDIKKINLSRLSQLTGISRQRLRTLKKTNFTVAPHGNTGKDKLLIISV